MYAATKYTADQHQNYYKNNVCYDASRSGCYFADFGIAFTKYC